MIIKQSLRVQPGHRVEVVSPDLPVGVMVNVTVEQIHSPPLDTSSIVQFLDSLPDGPRAFSSWEQYDQHLREDRESWDR